MPRQTDPSPIAVGVVGLGSLGRRLCQQFVELPRSDLVAISDVDPDGLTEVGDSFDVLEAHRYRSFEAFLDSAPMDAVAVATPNGLHYEQTSAVLDRGLHVLCEKPLATDAEEAYELTTRAEASDQTVMVGYQRHFNPAYKRARDEWADGDRVPRFITGEVTHDWQSYYETEDDWRMSPELSGGGHLLNVGTHVIDAILWTTGLTPTHVNAYVDFHDDEQVFDRQSSIIIEFAEGAVANVSDTGVVARTREHVHIWDDEGAIYLEGHEWDDRTGYVIDDEGTEHHPYDGYERWLSKGTAFLDAIETGETPPATARDGLKAVLITMAAYESGRRNERVALDDRYPFAADVFQ
ncbi:MULTISPECIES: Gfo/Idh/MocA family protein [unclassified Haloferax]|uniref:Gfo/Idh/MocA family protein n=1 Tax=unclassified Haloferax TaxID=2625095 RepID=UPI0002B1462E|nr:MULTISPECIES: Gfo/Idh/MocA family oxidoreductase [unclassified Haloferax]ELZ60639.1 glucose-fructose oxidoreductase [Haloferax sp. ATCC BAA-645]ELZ61794.1 glucose-fructose oxidoreductase [Haloferax sp. ATCC BAA-646]ELZ71550.1 glucose-fructose oxidoreductase [Haloferax sp. ATCC BAA-644]